MRLVLLLLLLASARLCMHQALLHARHSIMLVALGACRALLIACPNL